MSGSRRGHDFGGLEVRRLASGWVVQEVGGGRKLSPILRNMTEATEWRDARLRSERQRRKAGPRPCMCCGHVFESEGIHNRLCGSCRHRRDALGESCAVRGQVGRKAGISARQA